MKQLDKVIKVYDFDVIYADPNKNTEIVKVFSKTIYLNLSFVVCLEISSPEAYTNGYIVKYLDENEHELNLDYYKFITLTLASGTCITYIVEDRLLTELKLL